MNRSVFGALGVLAVLTGLNGCTEDPFSDLDENPAALVIDFTHLNIPVNDTIAVTASVLDGRATPLPIPVTFTACSGAIQAVADTSYHPVPATSSRALVIAGSAPAPSCVVVRGAGFEDTVTVSALPTSLPATISTTTPAANDTMTITVAAPYAFDPATAAVTFAGDFPATVLSADASTLTFVAPFADAGELTVDGVLITTFTPALELTLETAQSVNAPTDPFLGDNAFATAPTIPLPAAAGDTLVVLTTFSGPNNADQCAETEFNFDFGSTGPCVIYQFSVGATTTLTFNVDWDSGADLDIYACSDADPFSCFEDGGAGATGAQPQEFTFDFPAGTHYFVVENFDGVTTRNIKVTIRRP